MSQTGSRRMGGRQARRQVRAMALPENLKLGAKSEGGEDVRRDAMAVVVATSFMAIFVLLGEVPLVGGVMMLVCLLGYYYYTYSRAIAGEDEYEFEDSWLPRKMSVAIPSCFIGGAMIWLGASDIVSIEPSI